jgi:DNA-binding IclR family transcriptional regulator
LANLEDGQRQEEILSATKLVSFTPRTITSIARLRKDLIQIREQGYSLDDEEAMIGARCVGAAIFDAAGKVVGGISTSSPITRATKDRLPFFSAEVCKAAREISSNLGYRAAKRERANNSPGTMLGRELNHLQPRKSGHSAKQTVSK